MVNTGGHADLKADLLLHALVNAKTLPMMLFPFNCKFMGPDLVHKLQLTLTFMHVWSEWLIRSFEHMMSAAMRALQDFHWLNHSKGHSRYTVQV